MELKAKIKAWERKFFEEHGKKPGSADIKAVPEIYQLYKSYKRSKEEPPSTPRRRKDASRKLDMVKDGQTDEGSEYISEIDDQTPVKEVFPTPQMSGRLLGLFDCQFPETPSKNIQETPKKQKILATPSSRRTPTYLRQRIDESSPFKGRSRRFKSISELAGKHGNDEDEIPTLNWDEIASFSLTEESKKPAKEKPAIVEKAKSKHTKNNRVLRPVLETDVPVTSKAQSNFKRLNIQRKRMPGRR